MCIRDRVQTSNDIHEDQFVSTLAVVVQGKCVRVANNSQPLEVDTLDKVGALDVEPRNDADASQNVFQKSR